MNAKPAPFVPASLMTLYHEAPVLVDGRMGRLYGASKPVDGCLLVSFRGGACGSFPASDVRFLLDSPLAMCHAARWLATRLGMEPGATAPPWFYDADAGAWVLHGMKTTVFFHGDSEGERRFFGRGRLVPDIHKVTDPAEALAAACVAVGGAS